MSARLEIHGFETSNNVKVRVALGYKGIPYDFVRIDPADRREIVRISGQHLTPVMVHGEVVLFDSAAILRYLDANFRDTPRLYGTSHLEEWAIEDAEFFARTVLAGPVMDVVHHMVADGSVDEARRAKARKNMSHAVAQLADKLEGREWLVGNQMSAADIAAACTIERVRKGRLFEMHADAARFEPWLERVMSFDRLR